MRAILTFHGIGPGTDPLSFHPDSLVHLLDALAASGHRVVPLTELLAHPGVPDQVALTFDDALASVVEEALPVLARRDLVATVFVVTDYLGRDNGWPSQPASVTRVPTMGWGELEALLEAGWDVGSHTATHPDVRGLPESQLEDEIGGAVATIRARLGTDPVALAWPCGLSDAPARAVAERHHRWGLGTRLAPLDPAVDHPLTLPRLDAYYLRERWTHGLFGGELFSGWLNVRRRLRTLRHGAEA